MLGQTVIRNLTLMSTMKPMVVYLARGGGKEITYRLSPVPHFVPLYHSPSRLFPTITLPPPQPKIPLHDAYLLHIVVVAGCSRWLDNTAIGEGCLVGLYKTSQDREDSLESRAHIRAR